jgi:hypothetical protein
MAERLLLKPDEAAVAIGVGRSKIYALIGAGDPGGVFAAGAPGRPSPVGPRPDRAGRCMMLDTRTPGGPGRHQPGVRR